MIFCDGLSYQCERESSIGKREDCVESGSIFCRWIPLFSYRGHVRYMFPFVCRMLFNDVQRASVEGKVLLSQRGDLLAELVGEAV